MTTDESCNVLSRVTTERLKAIRSSILSMVLATDMASHFEYIAKFKNKISGAGKSSDMCLMVSCAHLRLENGRAQLQRYQRLPVGDGHCNEMRGH